MWSHLASAAAGSALTLAIIAVACWRAAARAHADLEEPIEHVRRGML